MINSPVRLQHLKDSFNSFENISDNWLINIRGKYRDEALDFLADRLKEKMIRFDLLDEKRGWYTNSLEILKSAKYDYVLLWLEDHINIVSQGVYSELVAEMKNNNVDYLMYSWWMNGESRKPFELDSLKAGTYIDTVELDKNNWQKRLNDGYQGHLISLLGIFNKNFLMKILELENGYKFPRWVTTNIFRVMIILSRLGVKFNHGKLFDSINTVLGGKLIKNLKDRPFEFEKSAYRLDVLPINMGLTKMELFVCIDDDLTLDGSQLIKRGLYPIVDSISVDSGLKKEYDWGMEEILSDNHFYIITRYKLRENQVFSEIYYQDIQRIDVVPRMTIINNSGKLKVTIGNNINELLSGQTMTVYSNIKCELLAVDGDCEFILVIPSGLKKM